MIHLKYKSSAQHLNCNKGIGIISCSFGQKTKNSFNNINFNNRNNNYIKL